MSKGKKLIYCKNCGSPNFYGIEEPPEPGDWPITVWTMLCIECNKEVLVKSNYD
jgi:hypothetical protein